MDHILGHNSDIHKLTIINIVPGNISGHNIMKIEINHAKKWRKQVKSEQNIAK